MFEFSSKKRIEKIVFLILNSKTTYLLLILIILIQFILVGIIFFTNAKNSNTAADSLKDLKERQINLETEINAINNNVMRISALLYRVQPGENK